MADSPANSPPSSETPADATSPSAESSPSTPPSSTPPAPDSSASGSGSGSGSDSGSGSSPSPADNSDSSPPPAPPQDNPPPPSSPPPKANPPPKTPENPSPPSPEAPSEETPPSPEKPSPETQPAAPQTPSNQSPPSLTPSLPSPAANGDRNRENGNGNSGNNNNNNNNNNGNGNSPGDGNNRDVFTPSLPPLENRNSSNNVPSPPRSISPPRNGDSGTAEAHQQPNIAAIVGILVGAGLFLLLLVLLCICCNKKKKKKNSPQFNQMQYYNNGNGGYYNNGKPQDHVMNMPPQGPMSGSHGQNSDSSNFTGPTTTPQPPLGHNQSTFTYNELSLATEGFAQSNILGQGGFGYVHKGVLPSGKEVAVKSLKAGSGQGEREFQAEVEIISRVHHRHLVSLVGYCISGGQRLLVYEFIPNNTLEFHLYGKNRPVMEWSTRMKIALGSAKGLAYLHEDCHPRIIHRDIKAANILLDFSFETKVADFGLAKLSQDNHTHVSTRVMGTFGYLAPEYASSGKLSEKSDVFSYGVMLLELITGRPPVDLTGEMEDSLVDWARPLCLKAAQDGDYSELVDPRLERNYEQQELAQMAACAVAAIRHSARRRPKMSQIVRALEGDMSMEDLSEGVRAGQSNYLSPGSVSSEYDASSYSADMKRFRKLALESSEYGGTTSEYGLNPSTSSSEEMQRRGTPHF